jgi:hypothetical protein
MPIKQSNLDTNIIQFRFVPNLPPDLLTSCTIWLNPCVLLGGSGERGETHSPSVLYPNLVDGKYVLMQDLRLLITYLTFNF